jgi:Tfp pilus assembly protein PilP
VEVSPVYRKSISLLLALVCLSLVAACGKKDDKLNSFMTDFNSFTDEIVKKVDSAPNPSQGVDDAQKYFDSRKAEMQDKIKSVKDIGENQVSEDTKKKVIDGFTQDATKMSGLAQKYGSDPAVATKIQKLLTDYQALLQTANS